MASAPSIVIGIAGVHRKLYSRPMRGIVNSLRICNPTFTIVLLDEYEMEAHHVSDWPVVHVLLTMYSPPFPLDKVLAYCDLRRPVLVNNLHMQPHMMDRRQIRNLLDQAGVPTPDAVFVDRDNGDVVEQRGENGDTLVVKNVKRKKDFAISKPFVEKPVNPEDHSMYLLLRFHFIVALRIRIKRMSPRMRMFVCRPLLSISSSCFDVADSQILCAFFYLFLFFCVLLFSIFLKIRSHAALLYPDSWSL